MINRLCKEIETALHRQLRTPKDFDYLRERIYARTHVLVSSTTLKRLWGYLDEGVTARESTLSLMAQYLGYGNWEEYKNNALLSPDLQSSPVLNRKLSIDNDLKTGDRLRLTWLPDRICDIEYLGNLKFRVIASEKTRIKEGDTFECSLIVEGEPLYLDNFQHEGQTPITYVCGKKSGVNFECVLI